MKKLVETTAKNIRKTTHVNRKSAWVELKSVTVSLPEALSLPAAVMSCWAQGTPCRSHPHWLPQVKMFSFRITTLLLLIVNC